MKKIIPLILLFTGIIMLSCEPTEDIYDELDNASGAYNEQHELTLADEDYTLISGIAIANTEDSVGKVIAASIGANKFFTREVKASYYIPNYLGETYIALKEGSQFTITYNYSFDDTLSESVEWIFTEQDYEAIGLDTNYFKNISTARDSILIVLEKLAETKVFEDDNFYYVNCNIKSDTLIVDTSELYVFSAGTWGRQNLYVLSDADYESMNTVGGGGPGAFHNFSASDAPEFYLPIYLTDKYPYATDGDQIYLMYKYYHGGDMGTKEMFTRYHFDGSTWKNYKSNTEEFVRNSCEWVFSPITKISLKKEDYQLIVEYIMNHPELNVYMDPKYDNSEYYYGSSSYYDNFDMRVSKRKDNDPLNLLEGLSDTEISNLLWERLYEAVDILLETKYPTAQAKLNGAQVYYQVTVHTYEPGHYYYFITYKVTETGKFELFKEKVAL